MRQAAVRGLQVRGSKYLHGLAPVSGNPGGYYDLDDEECQSLNAGVAKVWPRQIPLLRTVPDKIVVLGRDNMDAWLESIDRQIEREERHHGIKYVSTAEDVLAYSMPLMDRMLEDYPGQVLKVTTEELTDRIEEILEFIGE